MRFSKFLIVACAILTPLTMMGFRPTTAFWQTQTMIKFTTGTQSIVASNCSGVVTIQNQYLNGTPVAVPNDLAIALGASGSAKFYSDSYCVNQITSATIASGTNSITIYFMNPVAEAATITATAPGYTPVTQNTNTSTNGFVWKGTTSSDWSVGTNWSGGVAPTSSSIAVFDGTCSPNCSPNLSQDIDVKGIRMESTYTGTITQGAYNILIRANGLAQSGGTFVGSTTAGKTIKTIESDFAMSAGTFTAPVGTTTLNGGWNTFNTPTINLPVNSTIVYDCESASYICYNKSYSIQNLANYANLSLLGKRTSYNLKTLTITVQKDLILGDTDTTTSSGVVDNGTIVAYGNVTAQNGGHAGDAVVSLRGNASGQTLSGVTGAHIPGVEINTGTNAVTLNGRLVTNYWAYTSSGTFTAAGSTLDLRCEGASGARACYSITVYVIPGSVTYDDVIIYGNRTTWNLSNGTMKIGGNLNFGDSNTAYYYIDNGTLAVNGNITATDSGYGGTATISSKSRVGGSTITGSSSQIWPTLRIDADTYPVTLSGYIVTTDFGFTSGGTFTSTGSTLEVNCFASGYPCYGTSPILDLGGRTYNNLNIIGRRSSWDLNGVTSYVAGTLKFGEVGGTTYGGINNGSIRVNGDITQINDGCSGSATLVAAGNPSGQTITGDAAKYFPGLELDAGANTVTLSGTVKPNSFKATSVGVLMTAGATLHLWCQAGSPCRSSTGTFYPGGQTYETLILEGYRTNWALNGETASVSGNFSFGDQGGSSYGAIDNGSIRVAGNITQIGTGAKGTGVIRATGNPIGQTITGVSNGSFPGLEIMAGANTVTYAGTIRVYDYYNFASAGGLVNTGSTFELMCASGYPCYIGSSTPVFGSYAYNNVAIRGYKTTWDLAGATLKVDGRLTLADIGTGPTRHINNGTIQIRSGMTTENYGYMGSVALQFLGTNAQTITVNSGTNVPSGNVLVNLSGAGTLTLTTALLLSTSGQTLTLNGGTINMAGFAMSVNSTLTLATGTTINRSGGTLSYGFLSNSGTIN